jgi:SecD/SecF fusion protein
VEKQTLVGRVVLIVVVIGLAVLAFFTKGGLKLGQDLRGGTTLRFSLDLERARLEGRVAPNEDDATVVETTLRVIESRIDKWGLAELNVVAVGDDKFEIALPSEIDPDSISRVVTSLGDLQFRMEVLPFYRDDRDDDGKGPARQDVWKGAEGGFAATSEGFEAFKKAEMEIWRRAREQGVPYKPSDPRYRLVKLEDPAVEGVEPDDFRVVEVPALERERFGGEMLSNPQVSQHPETGEPVVVFDVKAEFQHDFGEWTEANLKLPMAILLNDEYNSAPHIQSRLTDTVQVTLGHGSFESADQKLERARALATVLQTGSLRVKPRQESRATVGPSLAGEAVRRGITSTVVAFALVLLFMVAFYRWAGVVADLALLLNLVLLVGAMAFFEATLTLPGIAGVVLTLGMAVDANILIFERIREEQAAGRSVPRAIAEGYDRAFTTIVDSNVTTFITALFLYAFGSGSIQGFAVSLSLGLLASMFTAIYVTRTVFEGRLLRGNLRPIQMAGTGRPPAVRWMRLRSRLIPVSLALVLGSLVFFFSSKDEVVYDIDFTGGMKLQARFNRRTTVDEVKDALASGARDVTVANETAVAGGGGDPTKTAKVGPYEGAQVVTVGHEGDWVEIKVPSTTGVPGESGLTERERLDALRQYLRGAFGDRLVPEWVREGPLTYRSKGDDDPRKAFDGRLWVKIAIEDPQGVVTAEILDDVLTKAMPHYVYQGNRREKAAASTVQREIEVVALGAPVPGAKERDFEIYWKADQEGSPTEADPVRLKQELREFLAGQDCRAAIAARLPDATKGGASAVSLSDPFPVDDLIGKGVAKRQRNDALVAVLLSLVAIVLYVAFRFRSYPMGFSAILCLFHDVVVALGAVTLVNTLGVVDAKINLGLVAAFLTIVGFSVNDTVVTFDRIRELRGKAPRVTSKMIDDAVNQTLSRTWRTSTTALITVVVLFVANFGQRSLLEGLSFTLMVGMIAGVYSTVAIAAPLLLFLPWFWARAKAYRPRSVALTWPLRAPGSYALVAIVVATAVVAIAVKGQEPTFAAFLALLVAPLGTTVGLWLAWAALFALGAFVVGFFALLPWTRKEDPDREVELARDEASSRERERV